MRHRIYYSFHYKNDYWRVQQVKQIGRIDGTSTLSSNEWEEIKRGGDNAVKNWINNSMKYCSCVVVLVGEETAHRKWVKYEIEKAWNDKKGVAGIYIHNLKDSNKQTSTKGKNPFDYFNISGRQLSSIVECFDPPIENAYESIATIINHLVENALRVRERYR